MRTKAIITDVIVPFIILLKIKYWRNNSNNNQRIYKVKQSKHYNNKAGGFKENARLATVLNTEWAKTNQC